MLEILVACYVNSNKWVRVLIRTLKSIYWNMLQMQYLFGYVLCNGIATSAIFSNDSVFNTEAFCAT